MAIEVLLVLSTFPDRGTAQRIAEELVASRFAACANVASAVDSFYWWKGELETASEVVVFFKTTSEGYPNFERRLRSLHPYDVPEIVSIPITKGLPEYLRWVAENCAGEKENR
jgi:periplasmic divalent cation tolerance protein